MSIIGSSWKGEETPQEQYKNITGNEFHGTENELRKQIEKDIGSGYTSRIERSKLRDLNNQVNPNKE
jgi:hypothetical protein